MPRLLLLFLVLVPTAFGCAAQTRLASDAADDPAAAGYVLLDDLLRDEARVGGILVARRPSRETQQLIRDIAERSGTAARELKAFDLERAPAVLPEVEVAVRDAVASRTSRELLFGRDFEVRLLVSQIEALRYGRHLAEATAKHETDPDRRDWLEALANDLAALRERAVQRLAVRQEDAE